MNISKCFSTISVAALLCAGFAAHAASSFGPLVSASDLSDNLEKFSPIILDIRGDEYSDGHIDGAVSAPYALFRGPDDNPGQILDEQILEERFEALGLETDSPIVIVVEGKSDTDFGAAARVYWTLKSTGFSDLSILNGGVEAWKMAGLPLDKAGTVPSPTELDITFSNQWTADTEEVLAATRGDVDALLVDARPDEFFQGRKAHPAAAKPGTLPGAENFSHTRFFSAENSVISDDIDRNSLRSQLGVTEGQEVVSFCNTGHWAATNWFAMSEIAGIEDVKLYPGSMVEYSNEGYEMENSPGQ